ncbi:DUF7925 domain-containing protein [Calothrix sp. NIES-3974]|uniref:DUF7925 domain-containing protein n=1 Tax=Calothrix sp. NIES-3974 TaxID=2005462 RepID=UPI000B61677D|nr:hypothetical protein [Calothrix sp. NIES-3974]BAZ03523.1 hypothetical protein NIES3974_01490 [Calothrix sp. NIES-3974]
MSYSRKSVKFFPELYRSLVATVLITSGIIQFVAPVIAEGTRAGESISNTATATYEDPLDPNTKINATSNTVVVTVAEVAGITVTGSGTTFREDLNNNGQANVGDTIYYNYTVTNVGNDPTRIRIPEAVRVTGPGQAGKPEYSLDGGATWTQIPGSEYISGSIPVNGSILVRVPVTVAAGARTNDIINVTLGDTPGDAQNQLRDPNGGDVYTVDNPDGTPGEVNGAPVNGVREASATQRITVDQAVKTYALATVLKVRNNYDNAGTPAIEDDRLTYGLSLRVELNDPTGNGITPAPLAGTTVRGLTGNRILVSDAIPQGTELAAIPTPPPGWQVVYTTDAVSVNANAATWTTTPPANLATVTRVGFVNDPNVVTAVAPGQTVSGFNVQVKVRTGQTAPLTVNNIAQLFGQTAGVPTVDNNGDGIPDNQVYDESGDQNPSNYDSNNLPPGAVDANGDGIPDNTPTVTDGFIDNPTELNNTGIDTGNNNTGVGPGGEANSFVIDVPQNNAVLNGPERTPDAIGPTNNNDDFTNKSSLVPEDKKPGDTLDPSPVTFTNTVRNSGTNPNNISLIPTPPANPADLPAGTTVTITYGQQSKTYTWNGTAFNNPTDYITIPNLAPGAQVNYGVEVNLPPGTPLSTDLDTTTPDPNDLVGGFPVPITAFIDDGTPGFNNEPNNITINRVYTGFLRMVKESRVLPGNGPAVRAEDREFSSNPKIPAPGNIIEYRIRYTNISEAESGTGNRILRADKVVITEDGTLSTTPGDGKNNWAKDNDGNGQIDTSNVVGSARDSGTATIQFYSGATGANLSIDQTGTTADTDVSKYVNTVTNPVAPGEQRQFVFQRKVN